MNVYTFCGLDGRVVSVRAASEHDARHQAMVDRWGPPVGIYAPRYHGAGLKLVGVS